MTKRLTVVVVTEEEYCDMILERWKIECITFHYKEADCGVYLRSQWYSTFDQRAYSNGKPYFHTGVTCTGRNCYYLLRNLECYDTFFLEGNSHVYVPSITRCPCRYNGKTHYIYKTDDLNSHVSAVHNSLIGEQVDRLTL